MRVRNRQDYFLLRGDRYPYHQLADGPGLARLEPDSQDVQFWPMHSQKVVEVRPGDVQEISRQVLGLALGEREPGTGHTIYRGPPDLTDRVEAIERRLDALEARPEPVEPEPEIEEEAAAEPDDGIPDSFRVLMLDDEMPERFTMRMKRRWQSLQHLRMDAAKPTASRALPDMTEDEAAEHADLESRNRSNGWLD